MRYAIAMPAAHATSSPSRACALALVLVSPSSRPRLARVEKPRGAMLSRAAFCDARRCCIAVRRRACPHHPQAPSNRGPTTPSPHCLPRAGFTAPLHRCFVVSMALHCSLMHSSTQAGTAEHAMCIVACIISTASIPLLRLHYCFESTVWVS